MGKWDAIILTCPNKNSSVVLQQGMVLDKQDFRSSSFKINYK